MDVTPQVINEVEFHQKMRGYDPDEVDDFLERVAAAVEELQERVRQAEQRAVAPESGGPGPVGRTTGAPSPAVPAPTSSGDETDAIRRTLVLAQRTADAAIKEAEDEASRTLQGAKDQVQRLYTEAQEHARKLVVDAESEARKTADETRKRLVKEIIALEESRDALRADQGILERHIDEQRLRLRSSIGALQRVLDDPGRLRAVTPPELSGATRPESIAGPADADRTAATAATAAAAEGDAAVEAEPEAVIDLGAPVSAVDDDSAIQQPITGSVTFTPPEEVDPPPHAPTARSSRAARVAVADEVASDPWARPAKGERNRPSTTPVPEPEPEPAPAGDDAYLNSLREAMLDDTSASRLEPGEQRTRPRFGRRR